MLCRDARWMMLACTAALAACSGDGGHTAGDTELNVIVPNNESAPGVPAPIDIQTVEYTVNCLGNADTFLDNNASFPDEVVLNGGLEVVDGRTSGSPPVPTEIWQGFMDLPPGPCTVQLRARDGDGEVICTATEPFNIAADTTTKVNMVLICDVSLQAPVGMLDVDATFSFNVGNFCPDLFVLNCYDTNPLPEDIGFGPLLVARTGCEVRFRDGDNQCGASCDPQTCAVTPDGLTCSPGPDPGVSTTITCTSNPIPGEDETARMNCSESPFLLDTGCTINGDHLGLPPEFLDGVIPCASDADCFASTGISDGVCDPGTNLCDFAITDYNWSFFALCLPPEVGGTPGAIVTCTAVTTDGDDDCDKTKVVTVTCPGLTPCDTLGGGSGTCNETDCPACDDGNDCTANTCAGDSVCGNAPLPDGTVCTSQPPLALCQSGVCVAVADCRTLPDPDAVCDDGNECTVGFCDPATGLCANTHVTDGTACAGGSCSGGACNACPMLTKIVASPRTAFIGQSITVQASAEDTEGDPIDYLWTSSGGTFADPTAATTTFLCTSLGTHTLSIAVSDDGFSTCKAEAGVTMSCVRDNSAPVSVVLSLCCNNNASAQQSIIPARLFVRLYSVVAGGPITPVLSGLWIFPESMLDAAQAVVPAIVDTVDLRALQLTVVARAGATGPPVTLPAVLPPGTCLISGTACDPANDVPGNGNSDCVPQGSFNPCQHVVTVPRSSLPDFCAALDPPGCTVGVDCTKTDQYNQNGSCIIGPIPIALEVTVGNYTAGASGETILFGWDDQNTDATFDGTFWTVPPPSFASPLGPNGLRITSAGLDVAIECVMAVENGDTATNPVTCGFTPDNALAGSGVGGTAEFTIP